MDSNGACDGPVCADLSDPKECLNAGCISDGSICSGPACSTLSSNQAACTEASGCVYENNECRVEECGVHDVVMCISEGCPLDEADRCSGPPCSDRSQSSCTDAQCAWDVDTQTCEGPACPTLTNNNAASCDMAPGCRLSEGECQVDPCVVDDPSDCVDNGCRFSEGECMPTPCAELESFECTYTGNTYGKYPLSGDV